VSRAGRPGWSHSAALAAVILLGVVGCAGQAGSAASRISPAPTPGQVAPGEVASAAPSPSPAGVRTGRPARSTRVRFVPETLTLPGNARAAVQPAATEGGELRVPEDVGHVGWWDGSAYAGDPFGATVVAGHVDSATDGIGFFARLLRVRVGDQVSLSGEGHHARYRVVAVESIAQDALATHGQAFDQRGRHRLVLITCTGRYLPERGGYDQNLVVIAEPVGRAR